MEKQTVSGDIGLWAVPRDPAYVEPGENPFSFEICMYTANHWKKGAICVASQQVEMLVPTNIDFRGRAIDTLEAAIVQVQAEAAKEIATLKTQINNLLMLTHQPSDEPEFIPAEELLPAEAYAVDDWVDDYRGADHE